MFDIKNEVLAAEKRIRSYVRETPLDYSIALSHATKTNVFLKCENLQYTGAFKVRGAMNKLLSLSPSQKEQGVVTASSGNHGAAVAFGLSKLNIHGKVFVPENASPTKVDNIRNYNVPLEFFATDCMQTEIHALEYAKQHNMIYVSPYNDPQVIGGQGTIGLELTNQLSQIDAVLVPIGGGGLISGIAGFLKSVSPKTKMIGCLPKNSPVMAESVKSGHIINMETLPTLSDATAGGIEPGSITFEICQNYVDDYILVSEEEIKNAIISLIKTQHLLIEGAAGVALAALLKNAQQFHGKNVVVILSGANISLEALKSCF
ncbi:MAG TPA: threonine/serine dehydratase [Gammaproteobacteria bacterium]|jgi:threonine dehydratase|nr:threonine/serine dehydratase [Gammaproteobacteria bacterium]